ncbi:relaxase/mobilization nuclease domain-containing protein [Pedobacter soli]|uniref:Relaxase/Mobilisation nuclease domain-containing protein n=1 Tax=Pedobacter soli TaxID=390242 RepID=A0A1G6WNA2_9SPHI|nr:relaxase/mobilization nuclease domain-containing protein [Pedobacter soli]SDD67281.1 Relaxase/Mobilisation nuclease domain-containing protein [Pedobacter soli]
MVARIVSGRSIKGALNYNEQKVSKGKAVFLSAVNYLKDSVALNPAEKLFVLKYRAGLNQRVKTNCLHISLNFETNEKISAEKMQEIARDYMERIGFKDQPYLIYHHQDAAHPHCHIVSTNIDALGNRISLHNLGRDVSEKARQEIEIKYGLIKASGRGKDEEMPILDISRLKKAEYGNYETKKTITQIVNTVVQKYNYSSLAELNAVLNCFNMMADRGHEKSAMFKQNGLLYRMIDEKGNKLGVPIKASRIAGKHTLDKLAQRFEKNKSKRKIIAASLKQRIDRALKAQPDQQGFEDRLKEQKIEVLYRTSKDGQVYGVTFIDHAGRAVFNGSELGKAYGAKALLDGFTQSARQRVTAVNAVRPSSTKNTILNTATSQIKVQNQPGGKETYLPPAKSTNYLEMLLGRTEPELAPQPAKRKKKRRKRGQQTEQINL